MQVLPQRFKRYGLTLHPEKSRLVEFKPPTPETRKRKEVNNDQEPPTHGPEREPRRVLIFWGLPITGGHTRKGRPIVKRSTASIG